MLLCYLLGAVPSSPTHDRRSCSRTSPERKPNHKEYRRPSRYTKLPNIIQPIRAKSAVDSVAQINESPSDMEDKVVSSELNFECNGLVSGFGCGCGWIAMVTGIEPIATAAISPTWVVQVPCTSQVFGRYEYEYRV